jgi:hypothetical protein
MLASLVDTHALWRVIVYSVVAGVGVTAVFSFGIVGLTRFEESRRGGRSGMAAAYAALALIAAVVVVGVVVEAIVVMAKK